MSAYPVPLTPANVQVAMQLLTIKALGLPNPSTPNDPVYSAVRVGWQQRGQPSQFINSDVAYVRCITVDEPDVNRVRDVQWLPNPKDLNDPPQTMLHVYSYMRVWQTFWEFYGPNDFDHCRILHSALFTDLLHNTFAALGLQLYWVTDPACPQRVPYLADGQWWERTDFESRFNELVTEAVVVPIAAGVEVKLYSDQDTSINSPDADFTVELQS